MEAENLRAYEEMKRIEEEKKKPPPKRKPITGPKVTLNFSNKGTFVTLENFKQLPDEIQSVALPYPAEQYCVITGQKAKYLDPLTGKPYATLQAFSEIRQKFKQEQEQAKIKDYVKDQTKQEGETDENQYINVMYTESNLLEEEIDVINKNPTIMETDQYPYEESDDTLKHKRKSRRHTRDYPVGQKEEVPIETIPTDSEQQQGQSTRSFPAQHYNY